MSDIMFGTLPNYGFINAIVPQDIFQSIKQETKVFPQEVANKDLAGNIEHEYKLIDCKDKLEPFLVNLSKQYESTWESTTNSDSWRLGDTWVNYQKKYEFNPPHHHDGSFSFVIFVQVPFLLDKELENNSVKQSNTPRPGYFSFSYTNIFGEISNCDIAVDKKDEGRILFFPSKMVHQVFPFYTSDEYRITVSGNLHEV
tara:strand:+ start:53 stop:649 length:597 start_codon:yes stop_codon:yes gene_type:complete